MSEELKDVLFDGKFAVTCIDCGEDNLLEINDTRGWSEISGNWGDVVLWCRTCHNSVVIIENW